MAEIDVNVTNDDKDEIGTAPVVVTGGDTGGENATVAAMIFSQEQINDLDSRMNGLRDEIRQLWESQWNDWKAEAIRDLDDRLTALEVATVTDETSGSATEEDVTVIEGDDNKVDETDVTGNDDDTATDNTDEDKPAGRRKVNLLW